jgi:hypothetical protein
MATPPSATAAAGMVPKSAALELPELGVKVDVEIGEARSRARCPGAGRFTPSSNRIH